jgi:aminopeptidase N
MQDDLLWQKLLRGIQQEFKHKTIATKDIASSFNQKTGKDYTYFFEQYLKYPTLPTLQYQLIPTNQFPQEKYRWKADIAAF